MDNILNKELAQDIQLLSKFGKLLSHPARIIIITMIARNGNKLPVALVNDLGYSPKSLNKHIEELTSIGLIYVRKNEHKNEIYSLDLDVYSQLKEIFDKFFNTSWS
jgi:DNA-binding MarR family transcriptional regulator